MSNFNDRLKALRQEKGLSQLLLSEQLNMPRATVASWEIGRRTPDIEMIGKLADFFNVTIDFLLGKTDARNPILTEKITQTICKLTEDDPELADFIEKLTYRNELKLLSKQVKDLPVDSITMLTKMIKALGND
jgi:transcriptional regulator with XRE-family HTH domain